MTDDVSLSDKTSVGMPIRNLIGLIGKVCDRGQIKFDNPIKSFQLQ